MFMHTHFLQRRKIKPAPTSDLSHFTQGERSVLAAVPVPKRKKALHPFWVAAESKFKTLVKTDLQCLHPTVLAPELLDLP
ncbi:hypothetical protein SARC_15092, partial [Sphaeroforma arctica JP610]